MLFVCVFRMLLIKMDNLEVDNVNFTVKVINILYLKQCSSCHFRVKCKLLILINVFSFDENAKTA